MKILRIQGKNWHLLPENSISILRQLLCDLPGSSQYAVPPVPENRLFWMLSVWPYSTICPAPPVLKVTKMPDVGQEFIQQGDRRQILRRGTAEAMAAIEFIAVDGKSYRSVWRYGEPIIK